MDRRSFLSIVPVVAGASLVSKAGGGNTLQVGDEVREVVSRHDKVITIKEPFSAFPGTMRWKVKEVVRISGDLEYMMITGVRA
jgi:hypothetical protein